MSKQPPGASEDNKPEIPSYSPSSAGEKVVVYCSLPAGLRIQACEMRETSEPIMGGGRRTVEIAERVGEPVLINGTSSPRTPEGITAHRHPMVAGYAVTEGVPRDVWDNWLEANRDSTLVKRRFVFAMPRRDDGKAKELRDNRHGMEPFDPDHGDPRAPRAGANLSQVTRADEAA